MGSVERSSDDTMSDFEVALMDALRTAFEVLIAKGIIPAEVLAEMLRRQRESYPREQMPGAVFVMDMLLDSITDPARAEARRLAGLPPEGSA